MIAKHRGVLRCGVIRMHRIGVHAKHRLPRRLHSANAQHSTTKEKDPPPWTLYRPELYKQRLPSTCTAWASEGVFVLVASTIRYSAKLAPLATLPSLNYWGSESTNGLAACCLRDLQMGGECSRRPWRRVRWSATFPFPVILMRVSAALDSLPLFQAETLLGRSEPSDGGSFAPPSLPDAVVQRPIPRHVGWELW
jgi:hypothetical protein